MAKIHDLWWKEDSKHKVLSGKNPTKSEDIFFSKIRDAIKLSEKNERPYFVGFLDEAQKSSALEIAKKSHCHYDFWGGYENALRTFFAVFPESIEPKNNSFPIVAIYISFNPKERLSHRNFLGSLMGLGISRDTVGDILVGDGICVIFAKSDIADFIKLHLSRIGNSTIKFISGSNIELPTSDKFECIEKTVASVRLDSIVAAVANLSRTKAADLIREKKVIVNYRQMESLSGIICEGDVLSVRGKGKFIIDRLGPLTKKRRIKLLARKYK